MIEKMIFRKQSEEIIKLYKDKNVIKILSGIRRSGKSFMLRLLRENFIKTGISENQILYIDFEDFENAQYLASKNLYAFVKEQNQKVVGKRLYLLFDEIQEVEDWEKIVNSLYSSEKIDCDIYLTGSNANLLSSELATYLSGRYVNISVFPLSYKEFLDFYAVDDSNESFLCFMKFGGFPGLKELSGSELSLKAYIDGIYSTVLLKDVISRNKIRDTAVLEKIILYITDNIGNIFSAKKISDFMKSNGRSLAVETVYNDINYLQSALFLYKVPRFDLKGKKLLETMEKYYIADTGFRFQLLGFSDNAINGLLENIVFIELLRREYKVCIGKIGEYEIDFVAEKNGVREYFQVSYLLSSEETMEREYRPLELLNDNYPKYILTLDDLPESNTNGIIRMNLRKWLLG